MILFLTPYPTGTAASQRFRFEQYFDILKAKNIPYKVEPFWEEKAWKVLYQKGKSSKKLYYLLKGILNRWLVVLRCNKYDFVFIHREIYPTGLGILILFLAKIKRKKIIYDFDDAIWLPNFADNNKRFAFIKSYRQVKSLIKNAYKVSAGNEYLKEYALKYNSEVIINPTTIDTEHLHNKVKQKHENPFVIGWTGTHSTMKYLPNLLPVLDEIHQRRCFRLLIISDQKPNFNREYLDFIKWNKETEIEDLLKMDIGIMPLEEDQWSKGKCGFKALQYMSLGIPAMVSPVGVNTHIVEHKINGWICNTNSDWKVIFEEILDNPSVITFYSEAARRQVVNRFSVVSNTENFLGLFK